MNTTTPDVLSDVYEERDRQDSRWGQQNHPDGTGDKITCKFDADRARRRCQTAFAAGTGTWRHVLEEEVFETFAEVDPVALRAELVQVAAVAVAWIEAIDRRQ